MMGKQFEFADFIDEFKVNFTVYNEQPGHYDDNGKWISGGSLAPTAMSGIVLPLTNDELKHEGNGTYTTKDRKFYTTTALKIGQKVSYDGDDYTIDSNKDYTAYADVYIYFAKGVSV
jgi:hypothetical protein